jgi:hypothetical protein
MTVIAFDGDVEEGDTGTLEALIKSINDNGRLVSVVRLNSDGGSLAESVKLADLIRRARLSTAVIEGSRCASACFIVFAGGVEKLVSYSASIGVHGASDRSGKETLHSNAATVSMARLLTTFGVPSDIIGKLVVTGPEKIIWLTPAELSSMGATMTRRRAQHSAEQRVPPQLLGSSPLNIQIYTYWGKLHPDKARTHQAIRPRGTSHLASQEDLSPRFVEFLSLARRGDATSQLNVAQMYHAGRGISQNLVEAAKWYRRAADQGIPQAQQNLGIAHAMGYGLRQDFVEAYKWLNLACGSYTSDRDRNLAAKARDLVVTRMTASDIAESQRLSREWVLQREN